MQLRFFYGVSILLFIGCGTPAGLADSGHHFTVTNNLEENRKDAFFHLDVNDLTRHYGIKDWNKVKFVSGKETIPFEVIDAGPTPKIGLLVQLQAGQSKNIFIKQLAPGEAAPSFPKRTQAEISHKTGGHWEGREYLEGTFKNVDQLNVPPEHTDHSWFIRYEGPGWESDLVGYRFYLDWRNATDIFGKKTKDMVLSQVGQDGFDSYHEPADWGQDVLKVGKSLGVGAIGTWIDKHALRVEETDSLACTIVQNGNLESLIRTTYHGWKVGDVTTDLTADLSIHAGSRLTKCQLRLSQPLDNLCTGIVKLKNSEVLTGEQGAWGYLATWGAQSLAEDNLGMAVLYRKKDLIEMTEDQFSHVITLRPDNRELKYYFLAAWEQEPQGIQTKAAFLAYLDQVLLELDTPLTVKL